MKTQGSKGKHFSNIKEFCFLKEIGIGSFGSVKLALHTETNRCYAIKIIDLANGLSEQEIVVLEREINIHTHIDHPHVIKLWDTIQESTRIYMIMELAENGTLFSFQNKHPHVTEFEAFRFFSQTLNAVKYLHSIDIMHRDLKPENIILDNAFNVKICDLGWATDHIFVKRKTFCGTYEYMAPEMVFEKQYNYTIDTWALGVLLYQLLHGKAPFSAKSLAQMKQAVTEGSYDLGKNLSLDLKSLIVDILQFDPQKRPSLQKITKYPWFQRMKKQVKNCVSKMQDEVPREAEKQRERPILATSKKNKRLNSLAVDESIDPKSNFIQSDGLQNIGFTTLTAFPKHQAGIDNQQIRKKLKKKCKTQGEESVERILGDFTRPIEPVRRRQKQNINVYKQEDLNSVRHRAHDHQTSAKMKRIVEKINQISSKYPDRKKTRLKTSKDCEFS